jgi:hypothetical protein
MTNNQKYLINYQTLNIKMIKNSIIKITPFLLTFKTQKSHFHSNLHKYHKKTNNKISLLHNNQIIKYYRLHIKTINSLKNNKFHNIKTNNKKTKRNKNIFNAFLWIWKFPPKMTRNLKKSPFLNNLLTGGLFPSLQMSVEIVS